MTADTTAPPVTDTEIRDWARATGRAVGEKGRIGAPLRAEYEQMIAGMADALPQPPPGAPPVSDVPDVPPPARPETRPRKVGGKPKRRTMAGRFKAWLAGDSPGGKARPQKPRLPVGKLAERGWSRMARAAEMVNVPVGRCMQWETALVGIEFEAAVKGTVVDRVLQPLARAEEKITGVGSLVAMPLIVGALQSPGNQPDTPVGAMRHHTLMTMLEECVEAQLELLGDPGVAEKVAAAQAERASRRAEVEKIISMIFAPPAETADEAAEDAARRAAAASVRFVPPVQPGPDRRGQERPQAPAGARKARMRVGDDGKLGPE